MIHFIFELFLLIFFIAELPNLDAKVLHDNEYFLLAFVKEPSNFREFCIKEAGNLNRDEYRSEYGVDYEQELEQFKQKYEAYLGMVYLLRNNWHCENIGKELKKECQKYRNYLDIVYEYLFRIYAGVPTVKPMFYLDKIFAFGTLTETVKSLAILSMFYFNLEFGKNKGHKLETLFVRYYEPKLFNENELNYEKETFQGTVVKMGLELKWENEIKESHFNAIRLNFDRILEAMLKNAEKESMSSKRAPPATVPFNQRDILSLHWSFDETLDTLRNSAFIAFLRGQSTFEQIYLEFQKEGWNTTIGGPREGNFEEQIEFMLQKYETYFGLLYLMRQKWNCEKIIEQFKKDEELVAECEKFGKYLNIFHEYLFKIYAKTQMPELALQFPSVRPLFNDILFDFKLVHLFKRPSFDDLSLVALLNNISIKFFEKRETEKSKKYRNPNFSFTLHLLNEDKLGAYEVKDSGILMTTLRQKFDNKLEIMLEKARSDEKMHKWKAPGQLRRLRESPFYERVISQTEDEAFYAFVKSQSNFEHFCWVVADDELMSICKGLKEYVSFKEKKDHLTQKYEAHLGVMYLMKENWHCANIGEELGENEQTKCQKYRKYLHNFYEYLFSLHAEDDHDSTINFVLLIRKVEQFGTLIDVVKCFNRISKFYFFDLKFSKTKKYDKLEEVFGNLKTQQAFEQIFDITEKKSEAKIGGMIKEEFDEKLEEMIKRAKEMAEEEKAQLNQKLEEIKEIEPEFVDMIPFFEKELKEKMDAFRDKFGTLFISPFYGPIRR